MEVAETINKYQDHDLQKRLRRTLYARPSKLTELISDDNFEVWYTKNSTAYPKDAVTDAYAAKVLDYMAKAHATEIKDWEYEAGKSQTATGGSSTQKYQVWIYDIGDYQGTTTGFTKNPLGSMDVCRTWTVIEINKGVTPDDLLLSTCAHEYHHASQVSYIDFAGLQLWVLEASAAWIGEQVRQQYPAVLGNGSWTLFKKRVDWHQYHPEISMDSTKTTSIDIYDATLFFWFLCNNKQLAGTSRRINLEFWWVMEFRNDWSFVFSALDTVVGVFDSDYNTLDKILPHYRGANYDVNAWYPKTINSVKIKNNTYPHTLDYSTDTSHKVEEQTVSVNHLAAKYYKFVPGATLIKPSILKIKVDAPNGKDVAAIAYSKLKNGSYVKQVFQLDETTGIGEVGVGNFCDSELTEVVLVLVNYSQTDDNLSIKYEAELMKGFAFVIDDTGSMAIFITDARAAAIKVLNDNKANEVKRLYTLMTFKDGNATLRGQSTDEDVMKNYINAIVAENGEQFQESVLTSLRQAAELSPNSDIMLITDTLSNSYGVDGTYAGWGEVLQTDTVVRDNACKVHFIYYDLDKKIHLANDGRTLVDPSFTSSLPNPSGRDGYKQLCTMSGGLYFSDNTTTNFETWTEMILRTSTSNSTVAFHNGDGDANYTVPIDSSISSFLMVLNGDSSNNLALTVSNPSGTVVDATMDGVSVLDASGSTVYIISGVALATGNWTATVTGTGAYTFRTEADTTNSMIYTGDTSVGFEKSLNLSATFRTATTKVSFELVNVEDESKAIPVTLSSDDNINYTGTHIMDTIGSYRFRAIGDSSLQRINSDRITVSYLNVSCDSVLLELDAGESETVEFKVENLGTEEETYSLFVSSSLGWSDGSNVPSSVTLAGGASQTYEITVTVPDTAETESSELLSLQAISDTNSYVNSTASTNIAVPAFESINLPKVIVSYDTAQTGKDKMAIARGVLVHGHEEVTTDVSVSVTIGDKTFDCDNTSEWKASGKGEEIKYSYKSAKNNPDGNFQLILDFKKGVWTFKVAGTTLSSVIDDADTAKIILEINGSSYGCICAMNEKTTWKYSGNQDSAEEISGLTTTYNIDCSEAKFNGKYDNTKTGQDGFFLNNVGIDLTTFSLNDVQIKIDDLALTLGTFTQPDDKKQVYVYKNKEGPDVNVKFDLDKGKLSIKYKNTDLSAIDASDGIDIVIIVGAETGGQNIKATRKTKLIYVDDVSK